jgi:hypothetical protein
MSSSAANPSVAAAASLPVGSTMSTTPGMDSSSSHPLVSPFLAALLAGQPPPLAPWPISTMGVGSIASGRSSIAASVNSWPYAPQLPPVPAPHHAPASSLFLPSHQAPAPSPHSAVLMASPGSTPSSRHDGSSSLVPLGAPASTYGAGFVGQPLF